MVFFPLQMITGPSYPIPDPAPLRKANYVVLQTLVRKVNVSFLK